LTEIIKRKMKKCFITVFAILILVISAQRPLNNNPVNSDILNITQEFDLQCQKSIFELYLYMSTSIDQVIDGALPMEEYNTKVEELVSSLTDYCHKEIEEIMSDPTEILSGLDQIGSGDVKFPGIRKILAFLLGEIIRTYMIVGGFNMEFEWKKNVPWYIPCFEEGGELASIAGEIKEDLGKKSLRGFLQALEEFLSFYDQSIKFEYACEEANEATRQELEEFYEDLHDLNYLRLLTIGLLQEYPDIVRYIHNVQKDCSDPDLVNADHCGKSIAYLSNLIFSAI